MNSHTPYKGQKILCDTGKLLRRLWRSKSEGTSMYKTESCLQLLSSKNNTEMFLSLCCTVLVPIPIIHSGLHAVDVVTAYLGGPEAEGCRLYISFLFVHQQQRFVFYQTQILPCGHMSQSEWLAPADMTPTPPGYKQRHKDIQNHK